MVQGTSQLRTEKYLWSVDKGKMRFRRKWAGYTYFVTLLLTPQYQADGEGKDNSKVTGEVFSES